VATEDGEVGDVVDAPFAVPVCDGVRSLPGAPGDAEVARWGCIGGVVALRLFVLWVQFRQIERDGEVWEGGFQGVEWR